MTDQFDHLKRLGELLKSTSLGPIDRPRLHHIIVTPHHIPGGYTKLYRSDGNMVAYITSEVFDSLPRQKWNDIPVYGGAIHRFTGVPVYREEEK